MTTFYNIFLKIKIFSGKNFYYKINFKVQIIYLSLNK